MSSIDINSYKPHAIVIGLDGMSGIQTARTLARHKIPVIGIAKDAEHHCCKTNVCEEILIASTQTPELIETLLKVGPVLPKKAVLFPCHDMTVRVIAAHREALDPWFHIALPEHEIVETLTSKVGFYNHAIEHGFKVPQTFKLHNQNDAIKAAELLNFPGVLKPSSTSSGWDKNTMAKAYQVADAGEFLARYERCKEWVDELILQQWIPGGDDSLYSCNCYIDSSGMPQAPFIARKIRQWPPHVGFSSLGEEVRNDEVLNESLRLFASVDYVGLGYVEFKRDERTGEHYIIEPNIGRPTGRSGIAEAGGVELLYTMYCDVLGLPLPEERVQQYLGTKWIDLRHDFQSALYYWRKGELTLGEWRKSWKGRKAHTYFSWTDPAPFFSDIWNLFKKMISSTERKRREYLGKHNRAAQ
jgi:D-aspartate ligase